MNAELQDQYYVFTGPDGWAWVDAWFAHEQGGHTHVTCRLTPYRLVDDAMTWLENCHPTAYVDQLEDEDIEDAMRFAEPAF